MGDFEREDWLGSPPLVGGWGANAELLILFKHPLRPVIGTYDFESENVTEINKVLIILPIASESFNALGDIYRVSLDWSGFQIVSSFEQKPEKSLLFRWIRNNLRIDRAIDRFQ
jgi:hypothetical protein